MAKKKTWFNSLKEIFHSNPKSKSEKGLMWVLPIQEEKRRRWLLGRLKPRPTPALIAPPPPPPPSPLEQKAFSEAEQQQSKHALAVAAATAAAAEAAVFAARVAQEVVRLTATPQPLRRSQDMAALRIQTAFRGYLARRALRALKALVRLQAIVRGRAVRRQTTTALKSLQSLMKIQSQVRTNRVRMVEERMQWQAETKQSPDMNLKQSNQRKWDDCTLSKERTDVLYQNRRETALKRECISKERTGALYQNRRATMGYVSSYQEKRTPHRPNTPVEQEPEPENQRWIWLERWVDEQPWKRDFNDISARELHHRLSEPPPCLVSLRGALEVEGTEFGGQRLKCKSIRDDDSFSSSPAVVPNYMVATESAKAKYRSMSTPRQRVGTTDGCSDWWPHCKFKHSNFPYMSSDASTFSKIWRTPSSYQRSPPYWKGSSGPLKACRNSRSISVGFDQ
ncbi:hypothetical protein QJS10_CPB04g00446 [Acorus calamus]|uniref:DUF4005 domain-containing protein n=1 Tax=Acorus calamus TaxID=4465 RepID=A0AAV9F2N3_ACOCL|nr:hypothetical protein QJS10_CPB04g00446 [Acorus calamus]